MIPQEKIDFERIREAINYIKNHYRQQPGLEEIAEIVHLSPFHFQRLFTEWAGVSPKKFLQYISIEYARKLLKDEGATISETTYETGLSGTSRLHDLFIKIEGMTPAEYKNGGKNLTINFSYYDGPFGNMLMASTARGICYIAFSDNDAEALRLLKMKFPEAAFHPTSDQLQQNVLTIFRGDWENLDQIRLHLKGTEFQIKVWETLLKIPSGRLSTYGRIAHQIRKPNASRAVGTAIAENPVAYLIPCHRVILSDGQHGQYRWNSDRKSAIIGWEATKNA
jgi:AraC family transcriptional regulator, regulatory protein of adaptative response / methylated-DNA-[protein]-cysteine methyltransferase